MSKQVLLELLNNVQNNEQSSETFLAAVTNTAAFASVPLPQLLEWLDEIQQQSPISMTDFLLIRRQLEALNHTASADEATTINHDVMVPHDDSAADGTLIEESTVIAGQNHSNESTQFSDSTIIDTEAATVVGVAPSAETLISNKNTPKQRIENYQSAPPASANGTGSMPIKPVFQTQQVDAIQVNTAPRWAWWLLLPLAILAGLITWMWQPAVPEITPKPITLSQPNTIATQPPTAPPQTEIQQAQEQPVVFEPAIEPQAPSEWLAAVKEQADLGWLLREDHKNSALNLLDKMQARYPESNELSQARLYLKKALVKGSAEARNEGEWDRAQQLLDEAYAVLAPP